MLIKDTYFSETLRNILHSIFASSGRRCLRDQRTGVCVRVWSALSEWRIVSEAAIQQTTGITEVFIQRNRGRICLCKVNHFIKHRRHCRVPGGIN